MLRAIDLNGYLCLCAIKIYNIRADHFLPIERHRQPA